MPIEMEKFEDRLEFRVSGETLRKLADWEYAVDEMVFNEQLETGSYQGMYKIDDVMLMVMKRAKGEGQIMPYYGAGGSRGACVYVFKPTLSGCSIKIEHTVTKECMELSEIEVASDEITTSDEEFKFLIMGREYKNLRAWKNWNEAKAFTPKYAYRFGQVSLGATGFAIRVQDLEKSESMGEDLEGYSSGSGKLYKFLSWFLPDGVKKRYAPVIDITDYDDW